MLLLFAYALSGLVLPCSCLRLAAGMVKYSFPLASTVALLAWGLLEFPQVCPCSDAFWHYVIMCLLGMKLTAGFVWLLHVQLRYIRNH